jgi:hypothetical protein
MALFHELTHLFAVTNDNGGYVVPSTFDRDPMNAALRPNAPSYGVNGKAVTPAREQLFRNADTYAGFLADYYLDSLSNK